MMKNVIRKLEHLGILDIATWFVIIVVAMVVAIGLSVPVILEQPQWWGYQARSIGVELHDNYIPVDNDPVCLSQQVVLWYDTFYVARPVGKHLTDDEIVEWYMPFFENLGYVPEDIRPLGGIDGTTDSKHSHYIDAWAGQIYIDHIPCSSK